MAMKKSNHIDIPQMPVKKSFNAEQRRFFKNKIEQIRFSKCADLTARKDKALDSIGSAADSFRAIIGKMSAQQLSNMLYRSFCRYMNSTAYKTNYELEWRLMPHKYEVESAEDTKEAIIERGIPELGFKVVKEHLETKRMIEEKYNKAIRTVNAEANRLQESLLFAGMPQELLAMIRAFEAFEVNV
jgi:uncharacterized protein YifE (UPF0438 family)